MSVPLNPCTTSSGHLLCFVDSHVHFDSFAEWGEVDRAVSDAFDSNVKSMVAIGGNDAANEHAIQVASRYAGKIQAGIGYDRDQACGPCNLDLLRLNLVRDEVVAVGEIGLDYHYSHDTADKQRKLMQQMLELALEYRKPVVVHSREADRDTLDLLSNHVARIEGSQCPGVLHCFTGDASFAKQLLNIGFMISFSGIITFRNAQAIRDVAKTIPRDRLLIETDTPYLAPVPYRGKPNRPSYVVEVARTLAELRGTDIETIASVTTRNAYNVFGLGQDSYNQ